MSDYSTVRHAVRNTAIAALVDYFPTDTLQNSKVIFSHVNGIEPVGSYVVINILNVTQQGRGMVGTLLGATEVKTLSISAAYEVQAQFSFVGKDSGDISHDFHHRLNNPITLEAATRNSLGVMRKSSVRRAPQKRDTQWVEYHNMDVTFSYIANSKQQIDWVEAVVIEQNISDGEAVEVIDVVVPKDFVIT